MAWYCIYCRTPLSDSTKKAHIIERSLGGSLSSRTTVCNSCNEGIGRTINEPMAQRFRPILAAWRGAGRHATKLEMRYASADGDVFIFDLEGLRRRDLKIWKRHEDNRPKSIQVASREMLDKLWASQKQMTGDISYEVEQLLYRMHYPMLIHSPKIHAGFAKIALEYLAHRAGFNSDEAGLSVFEGIAKFICSPMDSKIDPVSICPWGSRTIPSVIGYPNQNEIDIDHRIVISGSGPTGKIHALVCLAGADCWRIELANNYIGSDFTYYYKRGLIKGDEDTHWKYDKCLPIGEVQIVHGLRAILDIEINAINKAFRRSFHLGRTRDMLAFMNSLKSYQVHYRNHAIDADSSRFVEDMIYDDFGWNRDAWKEGWPRMRHYLQKATSGLPATLIMNEINEPANGIDYQALYGVYCEYFENSIRYIGDPIEIFNSFESVAA